MCTHSYKRVPLGPMCLSMHGYVVTLCMYNSLSGEDGESQVPSALTHCDIWFFRALLTLDPPFLLQSSHGFRAVPSIHQCLPLFCH